MARTWASVYRRPFRRTRAERKSGGRSTRRSYGKKRTYRKKASRGMSKKRILNLTSRKKRDTMLPVSQASSSATPSTGAIAVTNAPGNGGTVTIFPWICTARDNSTAVNGGETATIFDASSRTATTCYMRGLKESIEIQTSSGVPWQWRRVCFTTKDPGATLATGGGGISGFFENSNGFQRLVYNVTSGTTADALALTTLRNILFKGSLGIDWIDYFTAPLDTARVTVKFDKTRTISSGNTSGCIRKYPVWHAMNHNLVYDDDELGSVEGANYFSVASKAGMGDFYVVDFFQPGKGSTSTDQLSFEPQATLYWHEK